jgi:putative membrane protein
MDSSLQLSEIESTMSQEDSMKQIGHKNSGLWLRRALALILFAGAPALVLAQSSPDAKFASEAASGGEAEVKLGQLAQQNGQSSVVKEFGRRMETDHSKANEELKQAASQAGVSLPSEMSASDRVTYERLSKLHGAAFDRAYAQAMVTDHEKDIAAFEKESRSGQNEAIKSFAQQTLPTLKEHLQLARQMEKSVSGS